MLRLCFLLITTMLVLQCNNIQNSGSNQVQKEAELLLNSNYKVKIITNIDSINYRIGQKLSFWESDNQVKEISAKSMFSFVNNPNTYVCQVAALSLGDSPFYLFNISLANGEPEYYVISNPKGEIIAYEVCMKNNCQTTLMQKNSQSKELFDFLQNDTIKIDFKDVF